MAELVMITASRARSTAKMRAPMQVLMPHPLRIESRIWIRWSFDLWRVNAVDPLPMKWRERERA